MATPHRRQRPVLGLSLLLALFLLQQPSTCWTTVAGFLGRQHRRQRCEARGGLPRTSLGSASAAAASMELWVDVRKVPEDKHSSFASHIRKADAVISNDGEALVDETYPTIYTCRDDKVPPRILRENEPIGAMVDVSTPSGQDMALGLIGSVEWIVITCNDTDDGWLMIPAENIISACQSTGTKLAAAVKRAGDVGGLSRALELGVDALCIDSSADEDLWNAAFEAREERRSAATEADINDTSDDVAPDGPTIIQGTCKRLISLGGKSNVLADRVCVDLVQSLKPTEGCWVGSSAKITALVLSEAAQAVFVPSRPFRVNAGPVHSYVVMGDGISTKYLSELRAGDEVLVYDVETEKERAVGVGRLKVEVRPCVLVGLYTPEEGEDRIEDGQVFLQQAETVRLGQRLGEDAFVRVTDLHSGENSSAADVLLRVVASGTHVGKAYSGKVVER